MANAQADQLVRQWGERFRNDALASWVVAGLRERSNEIWQSTFDLLQRESPEYRNSVDEEFRRESKDHCQELLLTIVAVASGGMNKTGADAFDFVRHHAVWRARNQVPLIASLHAYRLAHRTYWGITRESLLRHAGQEATFPSLTMLSDFWIEFFDYVGVVLAEAHAAEEALMIAQGTRNYVELIDDLLHGLPPRDAEAQRICALCGIQPGMSMAVAVGCPLPLGQERPVDFEVALRSLGRLIRQVPPSIISGKLVDVRNERITAIACGKAETARGLMEALHQNGFKRCEGNGPAVAVGISLDTTEIGGLPKALEEARLALEFTSENRPLMHFSDINLPDFLIRRADKAALCLIPPWARQLMVTEDEQSHKLSETIRAFAECNFNVKQTARRLRVHTNTVYFRLNRINTLTGVDPRTYAGMVLLLTALRLLEIHGNEKVGC